MQSHTAITSITIALARIAYESSANLYFFVIARFGVAKSWQSKEKIASLVSLTRNDGVGGFVIARANHRFATN